MTHDQYLARKAVKQDFHAREYPGAHGHWYATQERFAAAAVRLSPRTNERHALPATLRPDN